jgi:hypothetical protein
LLAVFILDTGDGKYMDNKIVIQELKDIVSNFHMERNWGEAP